MNGRAFDSSEGPAIPLLDLNSVLRFTEKSAVATCDGEISKTSTMRAIVRPLIHWATRNSERHRPIGKKWCKFLNYKIEA